MYAYPKLRFGICFNYINKQEYPYETISVFTITRVSISKFEYGVIEWIKKVIR
ncbi:hypothetical protein TAESTU_30729 [Tenacibaculum aestuarii]